MMAANGSTGGNNMCQESKPTETASGAITILIEGVAGAAGDNIMEGYVLVAE